MTVLQVEKLHFRLEYESRNAKKEAKELKIFEAMKKLEENGQNAEINSTSGPE